MPQESKGKLLIVDDDPDARQTLDALLSLEGYETRFAPDGQRTLAFAEADSPDLILLAVRMADIDGYEVCRRLKKSEKTRLIPVIFLIGLDDVVNKIRGFEEGGVDYITKPFLAGEVRARVETHLALHRLRKQIEAQNVSLNAVVQKLPKELPGIRESLGWEGINRERIGEALEERLCFESLLADLSARFVRISPELVDGEIENALKLVLDFFHVERSGLLRILPEKAGWQITHVAAADSDVPPVPAGTLLSREISPWAYEMLSQKRQVLAISSLDELPPEAHVDRQTWIGWGIRSDLLIPIHIGESLQYVIVINALKKERVWPAEVIPRLRLLGEIFVNALERRNAELALRQSEERLDLATASADAGIWIMDVDTDFVWVTDKLRELFGFSPDEELYFKRFLEVIHPDDREHVRDLVRRSLEKGEPLIVEYRIPQPDGSIRWIVARGRPYSSGSGLPKRLMGVSSDITQRKMVELQLSESRTLLSALVDSTSDMIWSVDSEHFGLMTFNRGLYEYFLNGHGLHIEAGMTPGDLLPTEEYAQMWRMFYRTALEEGTFRTEYTVYAGTHTLLLNLNRLERHGIPFGISVFGQDITERKQIEEVLRQREEDLVMLTGRLISTQEEELRRLSRELHDDLTQKLAVLAIDAGMIEQQLRPLKPQAAEETRDLKLKLIEVSEEVHDLSRQLHPSILDDLGLAQALKSEFAIFTRRTGIDLLFTPGDVPSEIPSDIALCLYRVIQEGLRNIAAHSKTSEARVVIKGVDESVSLLIQDFGIGFDVRQVKTKMGIGLTSMRERIRLVGGTMSVRSKPGGGTEIEISIPLGVEHG